MDKRVLEHYNGDITKANLDPQRREELIAKYGNQEDSIIGPVTGNQSSESAEAKMTATE